MVLPPTPVTPCKLHVGAKTGAGYGLIRKDGKTRYAHRVAYEEAKGPIPYALVIDHLCSNHACVAPDHLEAVTQAENARRGQVRRRLRERAERRDWIEAVKSEPGTQAAVGRKFGISQGHVSRIRSGDVWREAA